MKDTEDVLDIDEDVENPKIYMLTTIDNPYNPFTQWDLWYWFDQHNGYYSCEYLDRVSSTSERFSDVENQRELNRAIDWIVKNDPFNKYRKVTEDDFERISKESKENIDKYGEESSEDD